MAVSIYPRGNRLYIQYILNGKKIQRSSGLTDTPAHRRHLLEQVVPRIEAGLLDGSLAREQAGRDHPEEFSHYAAQYLYALEHLKTYRERANQIAAIEAAFPYPVTQITRAMVREWIVEMTHRVTPRTAGKYLGFLAAIFDLAIESGTLTTNPARGIKLPTHTPADKHPFTHAEVTEIITAAEGWFGRFLATAFYTGARPGELLALTHDDIDLSARTIRIERNIQRGQLTTPKTRYSIRTVPLFDPLLPYITEQIRTTNHVLFPHKSGGHFWSAQKLHPYWHRLTATLPHISYRDMYNTRHTFITHMLRSGTISVLELAQIVGHKNATQIMKNYARFIEGEHLKISRKIDPFG